jgi:hypothetical protein
MTWGTPNDRMKNESMSEIINEWINLLIRKQLTNEERRYERKSEIMNQWLDGEWLNEGMSDWMSV